MVLIFGDRLRHARAPVAAGRGDRCSSASRSALGRCCAAIARRVQLLALSVLAMLVYHPLDLYNAGFELSFGTVLGLMIFADPMMLRMGGDACATGALPANAAALRRRFAQGHARRHLAGEPARRRGGVARVVAADRLSLRTAQSLGHRGQHCSSAPIVLVALIGGLSKVALTLLWPGFAPMRATRGALADAVDAAHGGVAGKIPAAGRAEPAAADLA